VLVRSKNIPLVKKWIRYEITKTLDFSAIESACRKSPVDRAMIYRGETYPMPLMENLSGYNRETNTWTGIGNLPGSGSGSGSDQNSETNQNAGIAPTTTTTTTTTTNDDFQYQLDCAVLDFFRSAKKLTPKSVRDLRHGNRIASTGATPDQVLDSVTQLSRSGLLLEHYSGSGWILPEWQDQN
jgi:hypothetical protein